MNKLFIVATPIGNLGDMTYRAVETLKNVSFILCEDTRVSKKLLDHYNISNNLISFHQHSDNKIDKILELLKENDIALITDAGTPGVSDPGGKLIKRARKEGFEVLAIPGPSALTSAISISGIPMDKFVFMGFPPVKNKRQKYFKELIEYNYPISFYESSHRIIKTLEELNSLTDRKVMVFKELTKIFERVIEGDIEKVIEELKKDKNAKGEFVIIIV